MLTEQKRQQNKTRHEQRRKELRKLSRSMKTKEYEEFRKAADRREGKRQVSRSKRREQRLTRSPYKQDGTECPTYIKRRKENKLDSALTRSKGISML